jgi:general secretion pathway protein G
MKSFKTVIIMIGIIILLFIGFHQIFFKPQIADRWGGSTRPKMTPIEAAIDAYHLNTNQYPVKLEDMITCPTGLEDLWKGPYLKESQMYDPWNRLYIYDPNGTLSGAGYDIISYGADGKPGGEGYDTDIYND